MPKLKSLKISRTSEIIGSHHGLCQLCQPVPTSLKFWREISKNSQQKKIEFFPPKSPPEFWEVGTWNSWNTTQTRRSPDPRLTFSPHRPTTHLTRDRPTPTRSDSRPTHTAHVGVWTRYAAGGLHRARGSDATRPPGARARVRRRARWGRADKISRNGALHRTGCLPWVWGVVGAMRGSPDGTNQRLSRNRKS